MKVSHNWLQKYIKEPLPSALDIERLLTQHSFEVEEVTEVEGDTTIDVDVLNNRAHDCLSHVGIAKEIALISQLTFVAPEASLEINESQKGFPVSIDVPMCKRYVAVSIDGIDNSVQTPQEIISALEAIGQRSINLVVDITNYVMYEMGQPLHAYDTTKVNGGIIVRSAQEGEIITTLDGKEITLTPQVAVVADESGPLAIAGVKGGKKAEVTKETNSIIFEAANFSGSAVRTSSNIVGIRTDSSKRFENEITPEMARIAILRACDLLKQYGGNAVSVQGISDVYPRPVKKYRVGVSLKEINTLLGTTLSQKEVETIFDRLGWTYSLRNPKEVFMKTIEAALGKPYKYGASVLNDSPEAFDCSSLTAYACVEAGIAIPRMVVDQYAWGTPITESELQEGDIIFSNVAAHGFVMHRGASHASVEFLPGTQFPEGVDHMGVYVGNGELIHATEESGKGVVREAIADSPRFKNMVVGYRRLITSDEPRFVIEIPHERIDIRRKADVIEEIGRLFGYAHIHDTPLDIPFTANINPVFFWNAKVRDILISQGFSEVYTYVFRKKGDVEVMKPFAKDKAALRTNLSDGIRESIELNEYYADLVGVRDVMIFEIGNVFPQGKEQSRCAIAVRKGKGRKKPSAAAMLRDALRAIEEYSGVSINADIKDTDESVEFDMNALYALPAKENTYPTLYALPENLRYVSPSTYPFVSRDIAMWVAGENKEKEIYDVLVKHAGDLLVRISLFDMYTKEEGGVSRTSYAYRLVFQSSERTLLDEEVNTIMNTIYQAVATELNGEVR